MATDEWTLLNENDTVDAGVHVRMDLTTGEKWVKRLLEHDETSAENMALFPTGDSPAESDGVAAATSPSEYDYDMMYRTLSKLPVEERERMQLPLQNVLSMKNVSPQEIQQFQVQMKHIWEERQEQLRAIEFADLPEILKERIKSLREYLSDPLEHILQHFLLADDSIEESDPTVVTNIVQVLQDLEYHLQDVDMTRDFHTLGGWSLLVSLLDNEVHTHSPTIVSLTARSSTNHSAESSPVNISHEMAFVIHRIQTHAAWVMGTAVKNMQEFYPFAQERIHIDHHTNVTTPVALVLQQLRSSLAEYEQCRFGIVCQDHPVNRPLMPVLETKLLRLIYCLGALLRGNHPAQLTLIHLPSNENGTQILSQELSRFLSLHNSNPSILEEDATFAAKLVQRWMNLITDCIVDVESALQEEDAVSSELRSIQNAWRNEWCADPLNQTLQSFHSKYREQMPDLLFNMVILETHCSSHAGTVSVSSKE